MWVRSFVRKEISVEMKSWYASLTHTSWGLQVHQAFLRAVRGQMQEDRPPQPKESDTIEHPQPCAQSWKAAWLPLNQASPQKPEFLGPDKQGWIPLSQYLLAIWLWPSDLTSRHLWWLIHKIQILIVPALRCCYEVWPSQWLAETWGLSKAVFLHADPPARQARIPMTLGFLKLWNQGLQRGLWALCWLLPGPNSLQKVPRGRT